MSVSTNFDLFICYVVPERHMVVSETKMAFVDLKSTQPTTFHSCAIEIRMLQSCVRQTFMDERMPNTIYTNWSLARANETNSHQLVNVPFTCCRFAAGTPGPHTVGSKNVFKTSTESVRSHVTTNVKNAHAQSSPTAASNNSFDSSKIQDQPIDLTSKSRSTKRKYKSELFVNPCSPNEHRHSDQSVQESPVNRAPELNENSMTDRHLWQEKALMHNPSRTPSAPAELSNTAAGSAAPTPTAALNDDAFQRYVMMQGGYASPIVTQAWYLPTWYDMYRQSLQYSGTSPRFQPLQRTDQPLPAAPDYLTS